MLLTLTLALLSACSVGQQPSGACNYLSDGYKRLDERLERLPAFPLEQVPDGIVGDIQKCWAAKPYLGPQHSILLKGARRSSQSAYYLVFEPWGVTDVNVVFRVEGERGVVDAYQDSTL